MASALCGLANGLVELVVFRVLQGVGGGMMTPVGTAMLFRAFPPERRAKASTVLIIPTVMAPALGPVVGGLLVTKLSWRWIFYVNVPLGIAAFVFGAVFLREHREPTAGPFDVAGFVLSGAGLALVLYALSQGPIDGLALGRGRPRRGSVASSRSRCSRGSSCASRRRCWRCASSPTACSATPTSSRSCPTASFAAVLFVMPLFLQDLRGLTALQSGLTTFPQAIGVLISSQVAGRLYPFVGPRRLMVFGLVGAACTVAAFTQIDLTTDLWWIRCLMFTRGAFMAFAFIPLQAATYSTITPTDTGRATAIFSTQRQVAAALGVALSATVLATATQRHLARIGGATGAKAVAARVSAYHDVFAVAALLAAMSAVVSLLVRDEDAAATMAWRRRGREPATTSIAG